MRYSRNRLKIFILIVFTIVSLVGCGIISRSELDPVQDSDPTPTPTNQGGMVANESPSTNPCEGLAGDLKLDILVGPSEAVGLEPVTIGNIPFNVVGEGGIYTIQGGGPLESYSDVLSADWGTYTVTFEGDIFVSGECVSTGDDAELNLQIEMNGDQNVEIVYDGTQMNYPWSGTTQINAMLPVMDGATNEGEGWILTLNLD